MKSLPVLSLEESVKVKMDKLFCLLYGDRKETAPAFITKVALVKTRHQAELLADSDVRRYWHSGFRVLNVYELKVDDLRAGQPTFCSAT